MVETAAASPSPATTTNAESTPAEGHAEQVKNTDPPAEEPWKTVKHKIKAAGKEQELSWDEIIKKAEKAEGADIRFREAAEKEKKAAEKEKEIDALKRKLNKAKDPSDEDWNDLIDLIGFDKAKKFAQRLVWDQMKWEDMTDEQRELIQAKYDADQRKAKLKDYEEREAQRERDQLRQQSMAIIQKEIDDVLAKGRAEGLPVSDIPEIQELIVDEMIAYLEMMEEAEANGHKVPAPPSHEDVLRTIQDRFNKRSDVYVKRLSVDALKTLLTKEQLEGLRQAEIDQLYAPIPNSGPKQSKSQQEIDPFDERRAKPKKQERTMRTDDFFNRLEHAIGR